jgi:hypothetical protein
MTASSLADRRAGAKTGCALPMAKVKVAIKKQSPTSTAVFLVDVFVIPSSGFRAGCGMRLVDRLSVAAFVVSPMIEP